MKFTLSWLMMHLETNADLETILQKLTVIGLEVEDIIDRAKNLESFVVGKVVEATQHPDADRLRVCRVDIGGQEYQVVCGAPNARTGMKGVFAGEGSFIPGTNITLKKSEIRGIESCGMLLSEREMGLSDDHEGIVDLPEDTPVGLRAVEVMGLDDPIVEIAITPNRGDCLGVRGIARDLAAAGIGVLKKLDTTAIPGVFESPISVVLDFPNDKKSACPYFLGRFVRGVRNGPSPGWMQDKLLAIGLRPISSLVDITNFMTIDLGRPLHVFDAGKVTGDLRPRMATNGETLQGLDGQIYTLDADMCVIADEAQVEALGGIMGGELSGCTEHTTDVFIECAYFDPTRTAKTGRRLNLQSDARFRFERGVDPDFMASGMEIATRLVQELCGGKPSHVVAAGRPLEWQRRITLRQDRVRTLGGVELKGEEISRILNALGFLHDRDGGDFVTAIPSWRSDVVGEACLVEEIVRIYGYDNIPVVPMPLLDTLPSVVWTVPERRRSDARRVLAARRMIEAVTYSFLAEKDAALFGVIADSMRLSNPISSDLDVMRSSILPNLINAAVRNRARGIFDMAIFEVGPQFNGDTVEDQCVAASGIRTGDSMTRNWIERRRPVDLFDVKADVFSVLNEIGIAVDRLQTVTSTPAYFHPGRSGALMQGPKNTLAYFGEIHPRLLRVMDLPGPVAAFEIYLDNMPIPKRKRESARPYLTLSTYQKVSRDFAFVVDVGVTAAQIATAASQAEKDLITDTQVFDVFTGGHLDEGKKSLALSVMLQSMDKTLTDAEIEEIADRIVTNVSNATGATLRG